MRRAALAGVAVLVGAVVALGLVLARDSGPAQPAAAEDRGARVELAGVDPITARQVDLAEFAGRPVVVNFWASWCPGCYAEAEALKRFAARHGDVAVVGVNLQDSRSGARAFYRQFGWTWPSIADPNGEIAARLRLQGMPTTLFLDARHREVTRIVGETDEAGFEAGLLEAAGKA